MENNIQRFSAIRYLLAEFDSGLIEEKELSSLLTLFDLESNSF